MASFRLISKRGKLVLQVSRRVPSGNFGDTTLSWRDAKMEDVPWDLLRVIQETSYRERG